MRPLRNRSATAEPEDVEEIASRLIWREVIVFAFQDSTMADRGMSRETDLSEPAGLIVDHRLTDLARRVHHERSITRDRLMERNAGDEQELGAVVRCDRYFVAVAFEHHHVVFARDLIAEVRFAAEDECERVVRRGNRLRAARAGGETDVQVDDWRAGVGGRAW